MATSRAITWVERLVWILIYGGLGAVALGGFTRAQAPATGAALIGAGVVAVIAGLVLIYVRSRMTPPPSTPQKGKT
jgi:hypothetical protein